MNSTPYRTIRNRLGWFSAVAAISAVAALGDVRVTISEARSASSMAPVYTTSHDGSDYDGYRYASMSCGGGISVNSVTSCPFASDVATAYFNQIGAGSGSVDAYSLATHRSYVMHCTDAPHECTGGDDAVVYFP